MYIYHSIAQKVFSVFNFIFLTVIGAVPGMAIYPFLQEYFVTGLVIGSVKG